MTVAAILHSDGITQKGNV